MSVANEGRIVSSSFSRSQQFFFHLLLCGIHMMQSSDSSAVCYTYTTKQYQYYAHTANTNTIHIQHIHTIVCLVTTQYHRSEKKCTVLLVLPTQKPQAEKWLSLPSSFSKTSSEPSISPSS